MSFSKSLGYPLTATYMTKKDWKLIMKPLEGILLQKCGIASSFPRVVLYTSKRLQGLGAKHFWYLQELFHLETLCTETQNSSSPVGLLLNNSAEDIRLEVGCSGCFTYIPWERLEDVVTHCWLSDLMALCREYKINLIDPIHRLVPQRLHDRTLMDLFLQHAYPRRYCAQLWYGANFFRSHSFPILPLPTVPRSVPKFGTENGIPDTHLT
jgi:hypothetical protein